VTVFACGVVQKHYFLAMEILPGGDLKQKLEKNTLEDAEVLKIMREISSALAHSHHRKTLHRDIKPENIMFNEEGQAVLLDFGIAKAQGKISEFTRIGAVVGTPHYMSPERALGKDIDERSDLYALGVVMYEMLMGKKLFEGEDTFAISYAHVHEPPPNLPEEKSALQPILDKLLAKSPDDRYQSADQLTSILDKWIRKLESSDSTATQGFTPISDGRSKSMQLIIYILSAVIALGVIGFGGWYFTRETVEIKNQNLTPAQKLELNTKRKAANTFLRMENYDSAAVNFKSILTDFDCKDEDARNFMKDFDPEFLQKVVKACPTEE
jgi:serine/threonine protein kinase